MKKSCYFLIVVLFSVVFTGGLSAQKVVDRIAAVVDKEIVTESELLERINYVAIQNRMSPNAPELRQQILQSVIAEKLMLAQAEIDSIVVSEDEITKALDEQVQRLARQLGGESKVEEYYGKPLNRIKRENRLEMRKSLIVQRLRQTHEANISISRREVEEFYESYSDSLPRVPDEYELNHLAMIPKEDSLMEQATRAQLARIRDSIIAGGDFADFAKRYSQDGTAAHGGDLGWTRRGDFVPEFEAALFALKEHEISEVVKTQFGLHIIQSLERRGESAHSRHILIRLQKGPQSDSEAVRQLTMLRDSVLLGKSFTDLAKKYSEDEDTKPFGGDLGKMSLEQMPQEIVPYVSKLKEEEISLPHRISTRTTYGYQIVLMRKRLAGHAMSLESDFKRVEQIALYMKRNRLFNEWVEELKKSIYWEIRS
jgi:peptidyl-prolyl cis-trans isomerase SurA